MQTPKLPMPIGDWCVVCERKGGGFELRHVLADRALASSDDVQSLVVWFSLEGSRHDRRDLL